MLVCDHVTRLEGWLFEGSCSGGLCEPLKIHKEGSFCQGSEGGLDSSIGVMEVIALNARPLFPQIAHFFLYM